MRLELSPQQRAFRDDLRGFYAESVDPDWRAKYTTFEELGSYLRGWEKTLDARDWAVPAWPVEYGGRGADAVERAIFTEEMTRFDAPEGINRLGKRLVAPVLMRYGTEKQKAHIPLIKSSDEVWCQGFSEPSAGSDLLNIRTTATRDGDEWVVTGRKIWTSFAQFADWVILLVRTGTPESRANGISVLLVDLRTPGIEISPIQTMSGRSEFNEVTFDAVRVPAENLVGEVDGGWPIVRSVLQDERGAEYCLARFSDIRRIFEQVVASVKGADAGSGSHAGRLGANYARIYTIQLLATDLLRRGQNDTAPDSLESLLKLYTTETWRSLGNDEVLYWASSVFDYGGVESLIDYYESKHYTISAGTSEVQRNAISGRLLGLPSARRTAA
jgi:alkylation response protein AidB-like acyl-CoA dehydrogenase